MARGFHLYRPQRSDPELLEKTFVAREWLLEEVLERLESWEPGASRQHYLFIGPRGIGKTNLLRLVEHRVRTHPGLRRKWLPVALPEDFYRVSSVSDLFLETLRSLAEETSIEALARIYEEVRHDDDDRRVNDRCLDAFRHFHRETGRGMLLIIENLDRLLERQLKDRTEAHLLRKVLIEEDWLVVLCASPTFLDAVTQPEEPFFEFFKVHPIAELTPDEQRELLSKLAAAEGNTAFTSYLKRFRSRLRALYHFTGGNPRLTIMLYDLVAHQDVSSVHSELDLLLDQLTPFYQDRMSDLSQQEAKVLEAIAILPEGCTPTELASELRMPAKLVRGVLSRLARSGYVRPEERRAKRTVYILPERFFRIWHQMNHSRAVRGRIQYLLEFFSSWYASREERDQIWDELTAKFAAGLQEGDEGRVDDLAEYMKYVVAISEGSERLERVFEHLRHVNLAEGQEAVARELAALDREHDDDSEYLVLKGRFLADELGQHEVALAAFEEAIKLNKTDILPLFNSAVALDKSGRVEEAIETYRAAAALLAAGAGGEVELNVTDLLLQVMRRSSEQNLVWIAAYLLGRTAEPAAAFQILDFIQAARPPWRRRHCATALGFLGVEEAVDVLVACLGDRVHAVRGAAATALGRLGSERSLEPLIQALNDPASDVRGSAATALGRLDSKRSVEPLIHLLNDPDRITRGSAATALGWLGSKQSVEPLIRTLKDPGSDVRGSAATALGRLGSEQSVEPLIEVLDDPDPINRGGAATALGRLGSERSVEPLIRALNDTASSVRSSAALALGRITAGISASGLHRILSTISEGMADLPRSLRLEILRRLQRPIFSSGDLDLIQRGVEILTSEVQAPQEFWLPYEIAVDYLVSDHDPAVLERQQPEMREAVELLVGLFDEGAGTAEAPAYVGTAGSRRS